MAKFHMHLRTKTPSQPNQQKGKTSLLLKKGKLFREEEIREKRIVEDIKFP